MKETQKKYSKVYLALSVFLFLCGCLFLTGAAERAFSAETAAPAVSSGQLTANIAWSLEDDTLILSGTGELPYISDWYYRDDGGAYADIPWSDSWEKIRKVVVRSGITSCGDEFCEGRPGLESVVLEEGFLALGETCFRNCTSLKEVIFPDGFQEMDGGCFSDCTSLAEIRFPDSFQTMKDGCLANCPSLEEVVLPDGFRFMGDYCFDGCTGLKKLVIPESVEEISGTLFGKLPEGAKVYGYEGTDVQKEAMDWFHTDAFVSLGKASGPSYYYVVLYGNYVADIKAALNRINEIRREACEEGVPDPRDSSRKLKTSDYVPIKWSRDLEKIARQRAAEASLTISHSRPDGSGCFSLCSDGIRSFGEVLAWNSSDSMVPGINQWYGEKTDWVKQKTGAVVGHYTSMINPSNLYVGLGCFQNETGVLYTTTSGEFASEKELPSDMGQPEKNVTVPLLLEKEAAGAASVLETSGKQSENVLTQGDLGDTYCLRLAVQTNVKGYRCKAYFPDVSWSSSNTGVAIVGADGTVSTVGYGKTKITGTVSGGFSASVSLTVKASLPAVNISKITPKKKQMLITWKKPAGKFTGYQIQLCQKKNFSKKVTTVWIRKTGTKKTTVKKLAGKKTYYVRMRTYREFGGKKYYGKWSPKRSAKVK